MDFNKYTKMLQTIYSIIKHFQIDSEREIIRII